MTFGANWGTDWKTTNDLPTTSGAALSWFSQLVALMWFGESPGSASREDWHASRVGRLASVILVFVAGTVAPHCRAAADVDSPVVLTQTSLERNKSLANGLGDCGWYNSAHIVLLSLKGELRDLSRDFASACDPDVSFDGRHIVFAGRKRPDSPWAILGNQRRNR